MVQRRGSRGEIHIENRSGKLSLRWSYRGQRYYLSLNLTDTELNRKLAIAKTLEIDRDIAYGNFDTTLERYGRPSREPVTVPSQSVVDIWERYYNSIAPRLAKGTQGKYLATRGNLERFFGLQKPACEVTREDAIEFADWYSKRAKGSTVKGMCCRIKNAWVHSDLSEEVWKEADSRIKATQNQSPKPLTHTQVLAVLEYVKVYYPDYYNFVRFLFLTGVRLGEAIGLRQSAISADLTTIVIRESFSRGQRSSTKTGKTRAIPTNQVLKVILSEQLQKRQKWRLSSNSRISSDDLLVFPANGNREIDDNNFRNRVWKPTLKALGIPYRKPYSTRSTFVSHALSSGMNPVDVAAITGHNVKTMYEHYVGIVEWLKLPDLYV